MGLNREGYVLLALFVYLLVLLFSGFRLYGRSDGEPRGGTEGRLADALAYFGAGPLPLLLMGLPGLLLLDGWPRLAAGLSLALGCCLLPLLGGRLERAMERAQASTVYELLARTLVRPCAIPRWRPCWGCLACFSWPAAWGCWPSWPLRPFPWPTTSPCTFPACWCCCSACSPPRPPSAATAAYWPWSCPCV